MGFLCQLMDVSRSGYYKWLSRKGTMNCYEQDRELLTGLLDEEHNKHPSYGYHRLAVVVRRATGWLFSDNLAHKCCKQAGIKSKVQHYRYRKAGEEHMTYPNRIKSWNASRPLEIVVSDMTCLPHKGKLYEWTYLLDTYNNEIISSHLSTRQGDRAPYFNCLRDLIQKTKKQAEPVILHTDQGSVYSSRAFAQAHEHYTIIRSMSRAGTPTDNPIIESLNGWIKQEMRIDFLYHQEDDLQDFLKRFVYYFNHHRPAFALDYQSPIQFRTEQGFA